MTNKTDLDIRVAIITALLQRPVDGYKTVYELILEADRALAWVLKE